MAAGRIGPALPKVEEVERVLKAALPGRRAAEEAAGRPGLSARQRAGAALRQPVVVAAGAEWVCPEE